MIRFILYSQYWLSQLISLSVRSPITKTFTQGTADAFGFWDEEQTGDITATTFVSQLTRHNDDSKGGLMIRTSHDVDAPHVSILVNSGTGVTLLCRRTQGGVFCQWREDRECQQSPELSGRWKRGRELHMPASSLIL